MAPHNPHPLLQHYPSTEHILNQALHAETEQPPELELCWRKSPALSLCTFGRKHPWQLHARSLHE